MPHAKLKPAPDLGDVHRSFRPRALREEGLIIKTEECWLSSRGTSLLIECHVVEGTLRQAFYLLVRDNGDEAAVRLLPRTSPERTPGVFRAVAWVARCLEARGGCAITVTNLDSTLAVPFRPEDLAPWTEDRTPGRP